MSSRRFIITLAACAAVSAATGATHARAQSAQETQAAQDPPDAPAAGLLLRGPEQPPGAAVSSIDDRGVYVVDPAGTLHLVTWDRVLRVEGARAEEAAPYMPLAEDAWRARVRLERGDAISAEPLFEDLYTRTADHRGPTREVIAEGLMRCRLRRGAQIGAIGPWLALLDARAGGGEGGATGIQPYARNWAEQAGLGEVLDRATGLAPALPPMWLDWPAVRQFAATAATGQIGEPIGAAPLAAEQAEGAAAGAAGEAGAGAVAPATEHAAALNALYRAAAAFEAGLQADLPPIAPRAATDPGVRLVRDIVAARIGDPQQRADARASLRDRLAALSRADDQPWLGAWLHVALGRSLLREPDEESQLLGVAELLTVPASPAYAGTHPYLAGLALADCARALAALGRHEQSAALRRELADRFSAHPATAILPAPASSPQPGNPN